MHPKIKYEWILLTQQLLLRDSSVSLQGNSHLQNDKKKKKKKKKVTSFGQPTSLIAHGRASATLPNVIHTVIIIIRKLILWS